MLPRDHDGGVPVTPLEQAQREPGMWMSKFQAAQTWRCSRRTIDNWIAQKKVVIAFTPSGRKLVWVPQSLLTIPDSPSAAEVT